MHRLEPCRRVTAVTRGANRSSIANDSPELQQLSVHVFSRHCIYGKCRQCKGAGLLKSLDSTTEIFGQPWEHRGGILVGFLEL